MRTIKIISVNVVVFLFITALVEMFFQMNSIFNFISPCSFKSKYEFGKESRGSDIVETLGKDIFFKVPEKNKIKQDPRVSHYKYEDIEQNNKYPPSFFTHPGPSYRIIEKIKNTDVPVYDVVYKFNRDGLRQVDNQEQKVLADKFVIAAGDSFTFGEGTTQGLDYPSQLAAKLGPFWKVYNYGRPGSGPNDFYERSRSPDYFKNVKENEGVFIWLYIDSHMQRIICSTSCDPHDRTTAYIFSKKDFSIESGQLVDHGTFKESFRPKRLLIRLLRHSATLKFFNRELPEFYTEENFRLFFRLLNDGVKNMGHDVKITKKYFVLYDLVPHYELFKKIARENDFEPIRLAVPKISASEFKREIVPDGHPSSDNYWVISELLKAKILMLNQIKEEKRK